MALLANGLAGQRLAFSTHDWVTPPPAATPDVWADVKTPGDGWAFSVGTTLVANTNPVNPPVSTFSQWQPTIGGTSGACGGPPFPFPPVGSSRQVVVIQSARNNVVQAQKFFYGTTTGQPSSNGLSTVARGLAVALAPDPADTRIAICGETYDLVLPAEASQPRTNTSYASAGFVAVYDGDLNLLWSYQLYGAWLSAETSVLDLSVRWDAVANRDVVTYCGVSTNGVEPVTPGHQANMGPVLPFAAPSSVGACGGVYADGETHNLAPWYSGARLWDGMVGRLSKQHAPGGAVAREFHSIVGGGHQEGLFGLVEMSSDRFAVVGTLNLGVAPPSSSFLFPLTRPYFANPPGLCLGNASGSFGVLMVFDAGPTQAGASLQLEVSTLIGAEGFQTVARDVTWLNSILYVVGSSDDPSLGTALGNGPISQLSGTTQGYVVTWSDITKQFEHSGYVNASSESGIVESAGVGVGCWPEYPDHVYLACWTRPSNKPRKMQVVSLFLDTPGNGSLKKMRAYVINQDGQDAEEPSGPGFPLVTAFGFAFPCAVGRPFGGGIGVDERGSVTVVGSTIGVGADFPYNALDPQSRPPQLGHGSFDSDAVRAVVDMLPGGVCRTDGTGACFPLWARASGDDGTTPTCALASQGGQLARIFVDIEGDPLGGEAVAVLVDRPPPGGFVYGGVLQVGFPATQPVFPFGPGVELWAGANEPLVLLYTPTGASIREPLWLNGLPPGPHQFSIQFLAMMSQTLCPATLNVGVAASPALLVGYN